MIILYVVISLVVGAVLGYVVGKKQGNATLAAEIEERVRKYFD